MWTLLSFAEAGVFPQATHEALDLQDFNFSLSWRFSSIVLFCFPFQSTSLRAVCFQFALHSLGRSVWSSHRTLVQRPQSPHLSVLLPFFGGEYSEVTSVSSRLVVITYFLNTKIYFQSMCWLDFVLPLKQVEELSQLHITKWNCFVDKINWEN